MRLPLAIPFWRAEDVTQEHRRQGGEAKMSASTTGKVAIVTGAAHGIGRAMTLGLLGAGYRVMANDVDADSLAALVADAGDNKDALKTIVADVGRDDSADRIVASTLSDFG